MKHNNKSLFFSCVSVTLAISQMGIKYLKCRKHMNSIFLSTPHFPTRKRLGKFSYKWFLSGKPINFDPNLAGITFKFKSFEEKI